MNFIDEHHDEIARVLLEHWGLKANFNRLPGENINLRVDDSEGGCSVLKIVEPSLANLYLEQDVLKAMDLGEIPVPAVIPAFNESEFIEFEINGRTLHARLQKFLAGHAWGDVKSTSTLLYSVGSCIAKTHLALFGFQSENGDVKRTHDWDLSRASQHRNSIPLVRDSLIRTALEKCFHLHSELAEPILKHCPQGMLHGDVNDENVLVADDVVVGLLDVGDAQWGACIQDLAIGLSYALQQSGVNLELARSLVEGYESVRPLEKNEQCALFPLAMARLATSACIGAVRKEAHPDHATWFSHEDATFKTIEKYIEVPPEHAKSVLCGNITRQQKPTGELLKDRQELLGPSLSLSYEAPLHIVRGIGAHLYSEEGFPYLDLVNNVCHVGHSHPKVVEAMAVQAGKLNTNTRYLHENVLRYAERIQDTLPESLDTCFFVNSGSEANELAIRLARAATGSDDMLVIDGAYHGNTTQCVAMSPYKFNGPGGEGASDWVHVVPVPDGYRGDIRGDGEEVGEAYALQVAAIIDDILERGRSVGGFFAEPILSCGGQIPLPNGYLAKAFELVRNAGGICIADEVQVGFGRVGESFWGFELHQVVPDIVVMGKPIGNGHPMGAVVTTRKIADVFNTGMEFFSTFGGNPVSCACGLAVLDVIESEGLQERARTLGAYFLNGLEKLKNRHEIIGDVRGNGLFIGLELVRNRLTLEPAAREAAEIVNAMRHRGVLLSTDGPLHNVIKIKPPLVISKADISMTLRLLDDVLVAYSPK